MKAPKISDAVIRRLPVYLRYLTYLDSLGVKTVSSQELGEKLGMNPAQIRKDLAHFGEFGRKGVGYDVPYLIEKIRQILKLDRPIPLCLVGAGHLGHALCHYTMYRQDNLRIVAVFDNDPAKIGREIGALRIQPIEELPDTVKAKGIRIGIIAVPADAAQRVADLLVEAGIEAILNFSPVNLRVKEGVRVHHADVTLELHSLAYYLP